MLSCGYWKEFEMGDAELTQSFEIELGKWSAKTPNVVRGQKIGAKSVSARNRMIKKVLIAFGLITTIALFCVWSRLQVLQMGYENSKLQKQNDDLKDIVRKMDVEMAKLRSPANLGRIAVERLGMHPPASGQLVIIREGDNVLEKTNTGGAAVSA